MKTPICSSERKASAEFLEEESPLPDNTITPGERYYAIFEGVDTGEGNLTFTVKLNG